METRRCSLRDGKCRGEFIPVCDCFEFPSLLLHASCRVRLSKNMKKVTALQANAFVLTCALDPSAYRRITTLRATFSGF